MVNENFKWCRRDLYPLCGLTSSFSPPDSLGNFLVFFWLSDRKDSLDFQKDRYLHFKAQKVKF